MGPPTYSQRLHAGLDNLTPQQRTVRLAVDEYFSRMNRSGRRELVIRFRRLGQFYKIGREMWPQALDRLFSSDYCQAEETASSFRKWTRYQTTWSDALKTKINPWGFLKLSRALRERGAIKWELKHTRTQLQEREWETCSGDYQAQVSKWLRIQAVRRLSDRTLYRIRAELMALGVYLGGQGISFQQLSSDQALTWLEGVRDSGVSSSTMNVRLCMAKRFFHWLTLEKKVTQSAFETFQTVRRTYKLPHVLEEREVLRLIRGANSYRAKAILEVLYATGCRGSELCGLNVDRISFRERTARTIGKGGHERVLYLNESAIEAIRRYLPVRDRLTSRLGITDEPALFLTRDGNRLTIHAVINTAKIAAERAEFSKRIHPHMLRHTFATHLLNRGADLFSIMQFLGHKNIQSTVRYLHVATARLSSVHRKFHPRR